VVDPNGNIISINVRDPRDIKALKYFEEAESWATCRVQVDGRIVKAYGLRSITDHSVYHLTNLHQCSCPDFQYRQDGHGGFRCAHLRAVRWYVDWRKAEERRQAARAAAAASTSGATGSKELVDAF
jgi:hypothetical protein